MDMITPHFKPLRLKDITPPFHPALPLNTTGKLLPIQGQSGCLQLTSGEQAAGICHLTSWAFCDHFL